MTRGRWIGIVGVVIVVMVSQVALAQTTGSIRGRVLDENGQEMPGVTVVVTGEALGSAQRSAVTSASGGFNFTAVPIASYTVTASLPGYQTQAAEDVRVSIGKVTSVDFTMPEAFSEEIVVIAETPIVDVASPTFNTRFDNEQIIDLPTRGNFYDMIALTPGVSAMGEGSNALAAFGADTKSSQWNIDGLDRTAPEGGDLSWSMNDEMVQEIQVLGTGATAEYGGMLGTAFNVVTKSGTNDFHGSAALDYWPSSWVDENGKREDAPEGAQTYRLDHHNNLAMTLGGPIKRDLLWFFVGAEWGRFQAFGPFEDSTLDEQKGTEWNNYDAKLTAQLAQNHRLNLTANAREFLGPDNGSIYAEPTTWKEYYSDHTMLALDYSGILGVNTVLEARVGYWRGDNENRPQYPSDEPYFEDYTVYPETASGGTYWDWEWEQHSDDAEIIITQHADDFIKGDHQFRFGVQYNRGGGTTKTFKPDWYYQQEYEYYPGYPYVYQYWYTGLPYYYGGESESIGVFATDSWTVNNHLTLDIGVRWDDHKGWIDDFNRLDHDSNPTGEVIPGRDMVDWNNIDPRLGFAWQPTDTGKSVLRGSIGLFHAGMTSGDWYSPPPGVSPWTTYWLNWDNEWEVISVWESTPDAFLIPGTDNAYTWEYTLGFDHQLTATSAIGVQAVYKETEDQIGWYVDDDGEFEWFSWTDPETGQRVHAQGLLGGTNPVQGEQHRPRGRRRRSSLRTELRGIFSDLHEAVQQQLGPDGLVQLLEVRGPEPSALHRRRLGRDRARSSMPIATRPTPTPSSTPTRRWPATADTCSGWSATGCCRYEFKISSVVNIQSGRTYDRQQQVRLPNRGTTTIVTSPGSRQPTPADPVSVGSRCRQTLQPRQGDDLNIDIQILNLLNDDAVEWWRDLNYPVGEEPLPGGWVLPRRAQLRFRVSF